MIQTTGLIEVILFVNNMQKMVNFYQDTIGLKVQYPNNIKIYGKEHRVTFWTGMCTLALHSGGSGLHDEDSATIVFGVTDIDHARSYLVQRHVPMSEIHIASPGITVCNGLDPEGNKFSLLQKAEIYDIPSQPLEN